VRDEAVVNQPIPFHKPNKKVSENVMDVQFLKPNLPLSLYLYVQVSIDIILATVIPDFGRQKYIQAPWKHSIKNLTKQHNQPRALPVGL
jgi:pentose-5-phosphate-3-epimerase